MAYGTTSENLRAFPLLIGASKRAVGTRAPIDVPLRPNERWSMNFVSDQTTDGRRFRILAVVDDCTRECLALVRHFPVGKKDGQVEG